MLSSIPKQYLELNGRPVLQHTIEALLQHHAVKGLVIALRDDDLYWPEIKLDIEKPIIRTEGGMERADSVFNAIETLIRHDYFHESDWVLVHDAVRPCLCQQDIDKLLDEVGDDSSGGLLALPVRDTMKRQLVTDSADKIARVQTTISRDNLWHALTPQYFPAISLRNALKQAMDSSLLTTQQKVSNITDESSAMELAGFSPRLVTGSEDNIKITRPDDLRLAALFLQAQMTRQEQIDD